LARAGSPATVRDMSAPEPRPGLLASFNASSLAVAAGFGVVAAVVLNPVFKPSFLELLGRTLLLSMLLLAAFVAAQRCPQRFVPRWLPRWLLATLAVALTAPLGTFVIYLVGVGGDLEAFFTSEPRIRGFVIIACTALVLGLLIALGALLREREARAHSLALQFELERSRLEQQASQARLAVLAAQIEPHFLFNTLANVQALVESGSPRAAPVLESLIAYLRAALPRLHDGEPTLAQELSLVRAYLELMQMRMPDRLAFAVHEAGAPASLPFPPMALLTLVENAVRHGIDASEDGGRIEVGADRDAHATRVWVTDTGKGLAEHAAPGTGLSNLRERLAAFYSGKAELRMSEASPHGLKAEIVIAP
jgi:signal transduction histidine kinase